MENETNETRLVRIKQLRFRAWRRGFREHDFLMGTYADQELDALTDSELDEFDALLNQQDWDVYYWIIGQNEVPRQFSGKVMQALQSFASLKNTMWEGEIKS
jgi:antitoxin CptB